MRLIDYRHTSWGHNIAISHWDKDPEGELRGHVWNQKPVNVGDEMIWETPYGYATAKVTEVKPCGDPWDMYWLRVQVIRREDKDGKVLWDAVSG